LGGHGGKGILPLPQQGRTQPIKQLVSLADGRCVGNGSGF
jgi:hypothetical protein